ncbi:transporter substrate-binding domain-containing protein [Consotaella aegiceratis]|uniref:transporter substrate-binding domain-containing protein n=1 Tax=Consotaella aegiceratis TaxID=3097961 RepID=UPI003D80964C
MNFETCRAMTMAISIAMAALLVPSAVLGQDAPSDPTGSKAAPARELVIGTKEAAPFAMKDRDGQWTGRSIDLWKRVAGEIGLAYRFEEHPLPDLIAETAALIRSRAFGGWMAARRVNPGRFPASR